MRTYYTTYDFAELVDWLPCPVSDSISARRAVFELDLVTGPMAGELFQITCQLEVTNDLHKITGDKLWSNVSLCTGLILCETSGQDDCVGIEITENIGENVTPGMHHGERVRARQWMPQVDMPTYRYLKLIAYCASSATRPGFQVQVMKDYGHLDCVRWSAEAP